MTEPLNRVGLPSRSTDSHGRTDGRTDEEAAHLGMNSSPNATRAGGLNGVVDSAVERGADAPPQSIEFGVEYSLNGEPVFVAVGYTREGAEAMVANCGGKDWAPAAARVVCREVGDWRLLSGVRPNETTEEAS